MQEMQAHIRSEICFGKFCDAPWKNEIYALPKLQKKKLGEKGYIQMRPKHHGIYIFLTI